MPSSGSSANRRSGKAIPPGHSTHFEGMGSVSVTAEQIRLLANLVKALESGTPPEQIKKIDPAGTAAALRAIMTDRENLVLMFVDMLAANPRYDADVDLQRRIEAFKRGEDIAVTARKDGRSR